MTFPDVSRREFQRIDERARGDSGTFAQMLVAAHFGVSHAPDRAEWFDAVDEDRGTKFEVKSTHRTLDNGAPGRFRLWRSQLRSLLNSDAQGTAWVVFVLLDRDGNPVDHRRMRSSTVWRLVREEFGGWDKSGHEEMGEQQKIPVDAIF